MWNSNQAEVHDDIAHAAARDLRIVCVHGWQLRTVPRPPCPDRRPTQREFAP